MKTPLKFALLLTSLVVLSTPLLRADDNPPPPPSDQPDAGPGGGPGHGGRRDFGARRDERMIKALGLSADQETKWKEISQQQKAALDALRDDKTVAKEDRRAKMMDLMKQYADQHRAILTPDQQAKFDEILAKMRHRMERRGRGEGGKWKQNDEQPKDDQPKDTQ